MLRRKLSKTEFDALATEMQAHYTASGSDYILDAEDASELKNAKSRAEDEERKAKRRADELQAELDTIKRTKEEAEQKAAEEAAKKSGDIDAINKSWETKLETAVNKEKAAHEKTRGLLRDVLVQKEARALASKMAATPEDEEVILPHIERRLVANIDGDVARTDILDKDGKASALTLVDLEKEFLANKVFSRNIRGSGADGGGKSPNESPSGKSGDLPKKFNEMNDAERSALYAKDPAEFRRLSAEARGMAA